MAPRVSAGRLQPQAALKRRALLCLVIVCVSHSSAQIPDLTYQVRGSYQEGVRTKPSTFSRLDLVAALIDYVEPQQTPTDTYHALFYLPGSLDDLHLIVREADDLRYFYWLDRPQDPAWQVNQPNHFDWPTSIIRYLNYNDRHQLALHDLGAIVRVGDIPLQSERVLPVALYSNQPPQQAQSYSFAFRPDGPARLTFEVFPENGRVSVSPPQLFDHAAAGKTQWVRFSAVSWKDGWYRMRISGYALGGSGNEVNQEVYFYHANKLGN